MGWGARWAPSNSRKRSTYEVVAILLEHEKYFMSPRRLFHFGGGSPMMEVPRLVTRGGPPMKILLIEDDAETAAYVAHGLEQEGHVIDRATTGSFSPREKPTT